MSNPGFTTIYILELYEFCKLSSKLGMYFQYYILSSITVLSVISISVTIGYILFGIIQGAMFILLGASKYRDTIAHIIHVASLILILSTILAYKKLYLYDLYNVTCIEKLNTPYNLSFMFLFLAYKYYGVKIHVTDKKLFFKNFLLKNSSTTLLSCFLVYILNKHIYTGIVLRYFIFTSLLFPEFFPEFHGDLLKMEHSLLISSSVLYPIFMGTIVSSLSILINIYLYYYYFRGEDLHRVKYCVTAFGTSWRRPSSFFLLGIVIYRRKRKYEYRSKKYKDIHEDEEE